MKKYAYSNELAGVVRCFLEKEDWRFSFDENAGVFNFDLSINSKIQRIKYIVDVKMKALVFYGIAPIGAESDDAEMMAQMAEFICRANYGLKNGSFELDCNDGEIRCKIFVDCDGVMPSDEVIEHGIYCTAAMYRRYAPGIVGIIFAGSSAKEAIARCEDDLKEKISSMLRALETSEEGEEDCDDDIVDLFEESGEITTS